MGIDMDLFAFFYMLTSSCANNLLNILSFFPLYNFNFFVKTSLFMGEWINIGVFDSIPLVYPSVFMPIPGSFYYCSSIIELDLRDGDACRSSFIVQDFFFFGYPGFFIFPYEVEYCSFKVCEELSWDFDRDCIESIYCFW